MAEIAWWDRIGDGTLLFPDGDVDKANIPEDWWKQHRARYDQLKVRYRLADEPQEIVALAGDIMIGYVGVDEA